ncbi:uncharacterized protein LOC131676256 [Topomyia yanbarensis]|uniref:uncharacterized protein LOC131676256 n=1 Tax=Topomyia yanbarensis TaxID=2498891 RepID=UPI00273B0FE9|nr:uncharacterized protein LOC131676256 [Topomyia yanbarensis]
MIRMATGHVLWVVGVLLLLSGLVCVRCEMKKSWQVKNSSENSVEGSGALAPEADDVSVKMARFDPEAMPEEEDFEHNTLESETERVEQNAATAASNSTVTTGQAKPRLRSTYVANRTSSLFSFIRESAKAAPFVEDHEPEIQIDDFSADEADEDELDLGPDGATTPEQESYSEGVDMIETILEEVKGISEGQQQSQKEEQPKPESSSPENTEQYDLGPVLNMTIDEPNNIVNVKLNGKVLKEIFTGRGSGFGGGGMKKVWKYAMPLFVLPFLIQSAIIPFMLTTVKLFLVKSFMAGKLAIFLLLLGAFKNFTSKKDRELYVKDLPERRYEPYSSEWPYPYQSSDGRVGWNN